MLLGSGESWGRPAGLGVPLSRSRNGVYASPQVIKFLRHQLLRNTGDSDSCLCAPGTEPAGVPVPGFRVPGFWVQLAPCPTPQLLNPSRPPRPGSAACQTRTRPSWTSWSMTAGRPWRTGRSWSTRSTTCRRRSARPRSCGTRCEPRAAGVSARGGALAGPPSPALLPSPGVRPSARSRHPAVTCDPLHQRGPHLPLPTEGHRAARSLCAVPAVFRHVGGPKPLPVG